MVQFFKGLVPRAGLSQERACPKSGPAPSILEGLSQERACPKDFEGPVPRQGLSQERACPKSEPVPSILEGLPQERACPKDFEGWVMLCKRVVGPSEKRKRWVMFLESLLKHKKFSYCHMALWPYLSLMAFIRSLRHIIP